VTQEPSEGPGPQLPLFSVAVVGLTLTGLGFLSLGVFTQLMNIGFGLWFSEVFLFFGVPYLTLRLAGYDALKVTGFGKPWLSGALFGFAIGTVNFFAMVIPIQAVAQRLAPKALVELFDISGIFKHQTPLELASVILGVCLAAPLCEELCFRGLLQRGLMSRSSPRAAVLGTALLFSAFHLDPIGFMARFELGVVFGILALRSGSLWPGVFAHLANNAVSTALYFFSRDSAHADDDLDWWIPLVMLAVGVPVLLLMARAPKRWPSLLDAREPAVMARKPVQIGELLLQWSVVGLAAIVLLITVDPNGVRLNLHDSVNPLKEPKKTDGPEAQKQWDAMWQLRSEARAGRAKLAEYEHARDEIAKARKADAGHADAGN
jgi:membrane protease YdiL (CAAX protease family)